MWLEINGKNKIRVYSNDSNHQTHYDFPLPNFIEKEHMYAKLRTEGLKSNNSASKIVAVVKELPGSVYTYLHYPFFFVIYM